MLQTVDRLKYSQLLGKLDQPLIWRFATEANAPKLATYAGLAGKFWVCFGARQGATLFLGLVNYIPYNPSRCALHSQ